METMPTGLPPSSTGRWRKPPWIMIEAAWRVDSSASTVSGSRVIHAATFVPSTPPCATARRTSRSVRIPDTASPVSTRIAPTPRSVMRSAAACSGVIDSTVSSLLDITSPTEVMSVSQFGSPAIDVRFQLGVEPLVERRPLVLLEGLLPDVRRPRRGVVAAVPLPALVVLGRADERPVEALAEALERVHRTEE